MSTDSQNNQRARKSGGQFILTSHLLKIHYTENKDGRQQKRKKGQSLSNLAVKKFMNYKNVVI